MGTSGIASPKYNEEIRMISNANWMRSKYVFKNIRNIIHDLFLGRLTSESELNRSKRSPLPNVEMRTISFSLLGFIFLSKHIYIAKFCKLVSSRWPVWGVVVNGIWTKWVRVRWQKKCDHTKSLAYWNIVSVGQTVFKCWINTDCKHALQVWKGIFVSKDTGKKYFL